MFPLTIYLKDHNRMPLGFGSGFSCRDPQAALPQAWCSRCGSEVFGMGQDLCVFCSHRKGENENGI